MYYYMLFINSNFHTFKEKFDEDDDDDEGSDTTFDEYQGRTNKKQKVSASQVMAQAVEVLSKRKEQPATSTNRERSNDLFGKFITVELDSIRDERVVDNLKFEIQKLLFNAKQTQHQSQPGGSQGYQHT